MEQENGSISRASYLIIYIVKTVNWFVDLTKLRTFRRSIGEPTAIWRKSGELSKLTCSVSDDVIVTSRAAPEITRARRARLDGARWRSLARGRR